jgi:type II secretory pathway pseudopilin PulG
MSKLNDFFQAIGIIGLIASLIFVGLELQQNQKIALAKTQQERNNSIQLQIMNFTASGLDWQSNAIENRTNYEFSLKQTAKRNAYHYAWFLYENDFFQYEQGLVSEKVWQAKLSAFNHWYNMCDMRSLYEMRSKWMPVAFRELIESFPDECRKS